MVKTKGTNDDLQNTTHNTKDRVRTPSKMGGGDLCAPEGQENSCPTRGIRRVTLVT